MEIFDGDLILRPPRKDDLEAIVEACSDPEIPRYIPFIPRPYSHDDGRAWLATVKRAWRETDERAFVVCDRESGEFLGVVTIRLRDSGSIGYWLSPTSRGRGVMTRAVNAVIAWATSVATIERLIITAHPDNRASQRVAERAGFVRVGMIDHKPPFRDGTTTAVLFEFRV